MCKAITAQYPSLRDSTDSEILNFFLLKNEQQIALLNKSNVSHISDMKRNYTSRFEEQKYLLENGLLLLHSPLQAQLDSVLESIEKSNHLEKGRRIFLVADLTPNAYTTGDGCIFVNIGLLVRLHNFDELNFIICHELSHELRSHVDEKILLNVEFANDKKFQRDLKNLSKEEYGQVSKLEKKYYSRLSGMMTMSRHNEIEADSLGKFMYLKCGLDPIHILHVMKILQSSDKELDDSVIDVKKQLSEAGIVVRPAHIHEQTVSSLGLTKYEKIEKPDSLKTHPDIPLRIEKLKLESTNTTDEIPIDARFLPTRNMASTELIFTWATMRNWGRVFYIAALENQHSQSEFSRIMMSISMSKLCISHSNRKLGEVLSLESIEFENNYNQVLHLGHELTIDEKAAFANGLLKDPTLVNLNNEFIDYARCLAEFAEDKKAEARQLAEIFLKKYPHSRFHHLILHILNS